MAIAWKAISVRSRGFESHHFRHQLQPDMKRTCIASRTIAAVDKRSGQHLDMLIEILEPYPIDNGDNYLCELRITHATVEVHQVGGIDSMQALSLALKIASQQFDALRGEYELYWPGTDSPMESLDYADVAQTQFANLEKRTKHGGIA